jgi:hypothetical protein
MTEKKVKLIKMYKGDAVADVHPDEVENYQSGGWSKDKPK